MKDIFKWFFVLCSLEATFSFLIKLSVAGAVDIEITFFIPLGNPKGRTMH